MRLALIVCCLWPGFLSAKSAYDKPYSHEFFVAAGYSHCRMNFFDAGLRYVHWRNDGQTSMMFGGPTGGCEFSLKQPQQIFIPYAGWQGQMLTLGYGLRAEYATDREVKSFNVMPETGWSLFEMLRLTVGYRWVLTKNDPLDLQGYRFSVVLALPVSLFETEEEEY
jgi:hypothetical protein